MLKLALHTIDGREIQLAAERDRVHVAFTRALSVARDAERVATMGIAPSARARTVRDWSAVWLRDYARSAPATAAHIRVRREADRDGDR